MHTQLVDCGDYKAPRGRTPQDAALYRAPGTKIILFTGQSMLANFSALSYYGPSSGKVGELSIWDGNIYASDGWQVLNCNGWEGRLSVLPYFGDSLVHAGKASRVLMVPLNIGGTTALQWCPIGDKFHRIAAAVERLSALNLAVTHWVHVIGQTDAQNGVTARNFADLTKWMILGGRSLGIAGTVIIGSGAYQAGTPAAQIAAVRQGQYLAAVESGNSLGADDDQWRDAPNWRVDGVHPADLMRYYSVNSWLNCF